MKDFCDFIFELGHLKKIHHEGWKFLGDKFPESVADHVLRAAQIGFILAKLEGYNNPYEICTIAVFHDINECRIGDIHKIGKKYTDSDDEKAVTEQTKDLGEIGIDLLNIWKKTAYQNSTAGLIAKDADLLEMAVTAKEYIDRGYSDASEWIENISNELKTESAKKLLNEIKKANSNSWWKNLKKNK